MLVGSNGLIHEPGHITGTRPNFKPYPTGYFSISESDPKPDFLDNYRFGSSDPGNMSMPIYDSKFVLINMNKIGKEYIKLH